MHQVDIVDDEFNSDLDPGCIKAYNLWLKFMHDFIAYVAGDLALEVHVLQ